MALGIDWKAPRRMSRLIGIFSAVLTRIRPALVSYRPRLLTTLYTGCSSAVIGMTSDRLSSMYSSLSHGKRNRANA